MWRSFSGSALSGGRAWLACVLLLCGVQTARQIYTARTDAQTFDEGLHLAAGTTFLKTGEYRLDREHPPLARVLYALPLLWMNAELKLEVPGGAIARGRAVLFGQRALTPGDVLFPARCVTIVFTLTLALALAFWMRARFTPMAGLITVFLFTLDPNIAALGHYVGTDFAAALGAFLAVIAFERLCRTGAWLDVLWAGLALGFALSVKFSTLFLLPVLALSWVLRGRTPRAFAILPLAWLVVYASYGGHVRFGEDLRFLMKHLEGGHPSYLLGVIRERGVWYYFPVVFAVKTPLAALLLLFLVRRPCRDWLVLLIPMAAYWAICLNSGLNIGLRHLLPVYPFTYALIGAGVAHWRRPLLVLGALLVVESALIFPYDLSFFNVAAGGPSNGRTLLLDSNLDWGQDLIRAKEYFGVRSGNVCLCYFGTADQTYYGFPAKVTPTNEMLRAGERAECRYVAISVTLLEGVYHRREWYAWLRERKPVARIGYSILVYDVGDVAQPATAF
ncbi:MAG: glycosyltransferase family 39 protein [Bryobacterales bacterium]|nr:glycosyltransferase family 39 protein [Bryobacterales bacterium]